MVRFSNVDPFACQCGSNIELNHESHMNRTRTVVCLACLLPSFELLVTWYTIARPPHGVNSRGRRRKEIGTLLIYIKVHDMIGKTNTPEHGIMKMLQSSILAASSKR